MIARRIYAVVVLVAGALVSSPAWLLGFPPAGDDSVTHAVWYAYFSKQFWAGDLYPRWLADMNAGLGSPAFFYYAPLPYHFASLLAPLFPANVSPLRPLGVAAALAIVASGLTAYVWLRKFCDERAAVVGAIIYMVAPYHLAFDLYMRDAFAEVFAFIWLPLILHFTRGIGDGRRASVIGLALTYAALVLTHLPTTLIFSAIPICYAYFTTPPERGRMRTVVATLATMLLGAGIAAIYWLPALTMQSYVSTQELESRLYYQRFVPSVTLNVLRHEGKVFWLSLLTVGLIVCAYFATGAHTHFARRARAQFATRARAVGEGGIERGNRERHFWIVVAAYSVFMMTFASAPVWKVASVLQAIQFPWRFNVVLCIAASAVVALSVHALKSDGAINAARVNRLATGFACLMLVGWLALTSICLWQAYGDREVARRFAQGVDVWVELGRDAPEYRPAWAASNSHTFLETFRQNFCGGANTAAKVCLDEGEGSAFVERWQPRAIALRVSSAGGASLRVRQFYYPNWTARLDGNTLAVSHSTPEGLLTLDVPEGEHRVELTLRRSAPELAGQIVSALCVVALLLLAARATLHRGSATEE